jgi:hypothetical protein
LKAASLCTFITEQSFEVLWDGRQERKGSTSTDIVKKKRERERERAEHTIYY